MSEKVGRALFRLRKMTAQNQGRILQLYDGGVPIPVLARQYSCSRKGMEQFIQENGRTLLIRRPSKWIRFYKDRELLRMEVRALAFAAGMSPDDIAKISGMNVWAVTEIIGGSFKNLTTDGTHRVDVKQEFPKFEVGQWIYADFPINGKRGPSVGFALVPAKIIRIYPRYYLCETEWGLKVCQHITDARKAAVPV